MANDLDTFDPFYYSGAEGTQIGPNINVHKTNSDIPHLPVYHGFAATHGTYRFFSVLEQVFVMIGEGKHGMWRIQENGQIREYLRAGTKGLPLESDIMDTKNIDVIKVNYSAYLPHESWSGYKYPDQEVTSNKDTSEMMSWVDLPLHHTKYGGKYISHSPIDLPHYYCTMSGPRFPHAKRVWEFAMAQPKSNIVGPLGKRAGLDITELYHNVIRLDLLPDARAWVNVGIGSETDRFSQTEWDAGNRNRAQTVNWQAVGSNTAMEMYMFERPFFNVPYLFVTAVFDNVDNSDFSYVRPHGLYWEHLRTRNATKSLKSTVTQNPRFHLETYRRVNESGSSLSLLPALGLPLYGANHPNRQAFGMSGGACPARGGDWSYYPKGNSGSGWPTNYEEITPVCDAILLDLKLFCNLAVATWNDPAIHLANAARETKEVVYTVDANVYGIYTDPYLTNQSRDRGASSPEALDLNNGIFVPKEALSLPDVNLTIKYLTITKPVSFVKVPISYSLGDLSVISTSPPLAAIITYYVVSSLLVIILFGAIILFIFRRVQQVSPTWENGDMKLDARSNAYSNRDEST